MKHIFNLFLTLLVFNGCQSALNVFDKSNTQYEKGIIHTKVKAIMFNNETKAIINITYLNSVNPKEWNNHEHNFLIGIYIFNDKKESGLKYINNNNYQLTLNKAKYTTSRPLTKEYKIQKNIPLKNPWAKYYIVSFNANKSKKLTIKYSHSKFGYVLLNFEPE